MDFCDEQALLERYNGRKNSFVAYNGIRMVEITTDHAVGEVELRPECYNGNREVHGGVFYTLADSVTGGLAWIWGKCNIDESVSCVTSSSSFHYLRPARGTSKIFCRGTARKMGRTLGVVDASVYDENGVELCCGTFTFSYIDLDRYRKNK